MGKTKRRQFILGRQSLHGFHFAVARYYKGLWKRFDSGALVPQDAGEVLQRRNPGVKRMILLSLANLFGFTIFTRFYDAQKSPHFSIFKCIHFALGAQDWGCKQDNSRVSTTRQSVARYLKRLLSLSNPLVWVFRFCSHIPEPSTK